ncbi:MAG: pyridoxal-phosphate dependent enzyme [Armatimonadota bacterium]|nr:pyridoxal-phosphate dependent enzyme [Armatimonadota bacterium]MDR7497119.1 pyridoxal-phosphate dependent enzyme [Armatimonadota bacterium]
MSALPVAVVCAGCGAAAPEGDPLPVRCRHARPGDDIDHVMTVVLDPARLRFPGEAAANPFVRYRTLSYGYHLGRSRGLDDGAYVGLVRRLDRAIAGVDGRGFVVTPFGRQAALSDRLGFAADGGVWVKDETGNVSGSHKARHLMGLLVHLEVVAEVGGAPAVGELAIASCGNAALAAAVVARAGGRSLRVFVPTWAERPVVERLERLGARLEVCARDDGVPGDPTYHALRRALERGAFPFTCQGPDNGLTIEGGKTLGYEIVSDLRAAQGRLDRVMVQVGGGALASACVQAFEDAVRLGALARLPRLHAVQTAGGYPLKRAYDLVAGHAVARLVGDATAARAGANLAPRDLADRLAAPDARAAVEAALRHAATHRSAFMWPWEQEPRSVAHGILDDETYDWLAVTRGMLNSGGWPVVVDEPTLHEANELGRTATGIDADHTGTAGLAGLLALVRAGTVARDERVAVLFTGVRR